MSETIEQRVTNLEIAVTQLKNERAGAKLDDVSQMVRGLRFDGEEQRKATDALRKEIVSLRRDFDERMGGMESRMSGVEGRLGNVETLLIAIAAHLGVEGEGQ